MKSVLVVLFGESYRLPSFQHEGTHYGSGRDRGENTEFRSFERQMLACESQSEFFSFMEKKFNVKCDIFFSNHKMSEKLDESIFNCFSLFDRYENTLPFKLSNEFELIDKVIEKLNNFEYVKYDFIFFCRIDFFLKKKFEDFFKLDEKKVIYGHVDSNLTEQCDAYKCSLVHHKPYDKNSFPPVCHNLCLVPKRFFQLLIKKKVWNYHTSADQFIKETGKENIDLFIYSYHYCSTDREWNPIYTMVDRTESIDFFNSGYSFDLVSGQKVFDGNVYHELIYKSFEDKLKQSISS